MPKQLIHDNASLLVLFKQDDLNLRHVYNDHVITDIEYDAFKAICVEAWRDRHGFLVMDKDSPIERGQTQSRFRSFHSFERVRNSIKYEVQLMIERTNE